jgi:hypothetical protein
VKPLTADDSPRSGPDLLRLGAKYRFRGAELVIKRDSEFKFEALLEMRAAEMNKFLERAKLQTTSTASLSEVLKFIKYHRKERVMIQFVTMEEVGRLLVQARQHPIPVIGLPLSKFQEFLVSISQAALTNPRDSYANWAAPDGLGNWNVHTASGTT